MDVGVQQESKTPIVSKENKIASPTPTDRESGNLLQAMPLTPNQNPVTPIQTKKKPLREVETKVEEDKISKLGSECYKTPVPTKRPKLAPAAGSGKELHSAEKKVEENKSGAESSSVQMPQVSTRKQELSKSFVSHITAQPNFAMQKHASDNSAEPPSLNRKCERTVSDISEISQVQKSPFLTLKKEVMGQIAGTPFEVDITRPGKDQMESPPPTRKSSEAKELKQIVYNGSFQLAKDQVISDQSKASMINSVRQELEDELVKSGMDPNSAELQR